MKAGEDARGGDDARACLFQRQGVQSHFSQGWELWKHFFSSTERTRLSFLVGSNMDFSWMPLGYQYGERVFGIQKNTNAKAIPTNPENHEHEDIWVFWKVTALNY